VWAVGHALDPSGLDVTLIEHWNGSVWGIIPSPNVNDDVTNILTGVDAVARNNVWAVGTHTHSDGAFHRSLVEHWDGTRWNIVPSQDDDSSRILNAVVGLASSDIWAVGGATTGTLAERWDGNILAIVPSPNTPINSDALHGVAALSTKDAWAVGSYTNGSRSLTLAEHWDGSRWSIMPSPNIQPQQDVSDYNTLRGVAGISPTDVWAVGEYSFEGAGRHIIGYTLVEHWDGSAWSIVASPTNGNYSTLTAVSALAANDVWAVGYSDTSGIYLNLQPIIEHWDGTSWSLVPNPDLGTNFNFLYGVAAISANDVWAVGQQPGTDGTPRPLIEHWDGSTWSVVPGPSIETLSGLNAVAGISSHDVWAVGDVILHWDGTQWSQVPNPVQGASLAGVLTLAPDNAWAVGSLTEPDHTQRALIEHWDGSTWSAVAQNQNLTDSSLNAIAGSQPLALWAVGEVSYQTSYGPDTQTLIKGYADPFLDVPPGSTFYPYARCLACKGLVNGYPDGTFRPNNPVTRGQLAKIVSNAAGFSDTQNVQLFQDVPVGSTFFQYIGRLASRGYMSGYPCGGVGEPCGGGNLPYFRPNNNASRGQLTKIVSNAAGFQDTIPTSVQTFADVAPNSAFWVYVERLLLNRPGVMGGYPCGGANEPCDPQQRPYFRPGNNVTRGQTSKIVANTFFPNCQAP
jgi:hypothetical protein